MKRLLSLYLVLLASAGSGGASEWVLDKSELIYNVSHPLHSVQGASKAAKGKGICGKEGCEFLAAATVKSFESGDTNRDLHMLETTKGAKYPMVSVRVHLAQEPKETDAQIAADLKIEFAGKTAEFKQVPFKIKEHGAGSLRIAGTIPATLKQFGIKPPSLLTVAVKNEIPISVDAVWKRVK